ncbi:MAG: sigma 54 modulation/S30EA ribosomal C-terminal domain-containing protein, partial [Erysipelotrichaceae bacterium]|nr:sigma 54 modulation/S30EA ribosomal C-terminal domain-containing protein [Erysipelotrichaceae bacterium]
QLRRQKTRLNRRHRESLAEAFLEEAAEAEEKIVPVKTKTIQATKLDLDEAIMQMELSGHDFYIYTDEETDRISVVYLRNDGDYGVIEVE